MGHVSSVDYWNRTRELGFALPRCSECGAYHFYPKPACPSCGSTRVEPSPVPPTGTLYSHSVVYRAPSPEFAPDVPYVVAIVAIDAGPHLMARLVDVAPEAVRIGARVRLVEGRAGLAPWFRPAGEVEDHS
jgi:uncharacterized OB-fold protein